MDRVGRLRLEDAAVEDLPSLARSVQWILSSACRGPPTGCMLSELLNGTGFYLLSGIQGTVQPTVIPSRTGDCIL